MSLLDKDPAWSRSDALPARPEFRLAVESADRRAIHDALTHAFPGQAIAVGPSLNGFTPARGGHVLVTLDDVAHILHARRQDVTSRIAWAHDLSIALGRAGVACVTYRATASGTPMLKVGSLFAYLTRFVAGRHLDGSLEDALRVADLLGRAHAAMRNITPPPAIPEAFATFANSLNETAQAIRHGGFKPSRAALLPWLQDHASTADPAYQAFGPPQILHGDLSPGNILFRDDDNAMLLDLENSCANWRAPMHDLAAACLRFVLEPRGCATIRSDDAWVAGFLEAYAATSGTPMNIDVARSGLENFLGCTGLVLSAQERAGHAVLPGEWEKLERWVRLT